DNRHPLGLQKLERLLDVEDRFRSGADDGDAGARQFDQVGGYVEGVHCAAVDAADAAGGEDFDARELSDEHRGGDRRPGRAPPGDDGREVAPRGLDDAARQLAEAFDLLALETDPEAPIDYGD